MLLGLKKLFSYYFVLRNTKNNNYLTVIKDNINCPLKRYFSLKMSYKRILLTNYV